MSTIAFIARMELKRWFNSPLAWSLLALVQFILAWVFLLGLNEYLTQIQPLMVGRENAPGLTDLVISALYLWAGLLMLAIMPIVTMRVFAEEYNNQTLTFLSTSPASITQIVLGKYLGLLLLIMIMLFMISLMPFSLAFGTSLDWGKLFAAMLGLYLLLASFAAAGMFISSITKQPIIAAVATFGFLIFLAVLYISGQAKGSSSSLFAYLSHFGHFVAFLEGLFNSTDLVYYLLFIITFVLMTIRSLDNKRLQG
ncbi:ABC transporter permease subunit [Thiolinea disciformis]|uniref:ABC transporter permease subunit n=1 Tax=Thiolinea disciformis TaxID=125614 RepID=UPI000373A90E|nr:ABC transporter permease subunit [Thiolinea disciformis]